MVWGRKTFKTKRTGKRPVKKQSQLVWKAFNLPEIDDFFLWGAVSQFPLKNGLLAMKEVSGIHMFHPKLQNLLFTNDFQCQSR